MTRNFSNEFTFTFSRSSGAGGQHVNKVSTKVELRFNIFDSLLLSQEEKTTLQNKLSNKISADGFLVITSQESRSQSRNKEDVIKKFYELIDKALKKQKKRIPSKKTKASTLKRLKSKKEHSDKKKQRRKPIL